METDIKEGYLRTTEVISPYTGIEFVPQCYLDPASDRGTRVHKSIESFIQGFGHSTDADIQGYIKSFNLFWKDENPTISPGDLLKYAGNFELEKRFYCDDLMITGQVDLVIQNENTVWIYDWKTSSKPQKAWVLQAAAYRYLYGENNDAVVNNVYFVHLKKDGSKASIIEYTFTELWDGLAIFKKCIELYNFFNMGKTRGKKR